MFVFGVICDGMTENLFEDTGNVGQARSEDRYVAFHQSQLMVSRHPPLSSPLPNGRDARERHRNRFARLASTAGAAGPRNDDIGGAERVTVDDPALGS